VPADSTKPTEELTLAEAEARVATSFIVPAVSTAELATDWMRISTLLSKPPPFLHGGQLVMNSVAAGRAVVIDAAIENAMAAPLHESLRAATERAAAHAAREKTATGVPQTWAGLDVTEYQEELEKQRAAQTAAAEVTRKKKEAAD